MLGESEPFVNAALLSGVGVIHALPTDLKQIRSGENGHNDTSAEVSVLQCMDNGLLSYLIADKSIV